MKIIAILAATLSLSLTACAVDSNDDFSGRPPLGKPQLAPQTTVADLDESFDPGSSQSSHDYDDGRLEWAEQVGALTVLHRWNEQLGIDEISVLDENGNVAPLRALDIDHAGLK